MHAPLSIPPVATVAMRLLPVAPRSQPPQPAAVESVWIEPPEFLPPAIALRVAPPPMLVQRVPRKPFALAVWIGGYWIWQRRWVWAHGMWSAPPRAGLRWVHPSYQHCSGLVLFTAGHWAEPSNPGRDLQPVVTIAMTAEGEEAFAPPSGPDGPFVPAPPGSTAGLIVPAPPGTAPAVVTGVPPIVAPGMRVERDLDDTADGNPQLIVSAPANATAAGRAIRMRVPMPAERAAAMPALIDAMAPRPRSELSVRYVAPVAANPPAQRPSASGIRPRPAVAVHAIA